MGPGEFFGELALIRRNNPRAADCVATQQTKVRVNMGAILTVQYITCKDVKAGVGLQGGWKKS
jgi:hypothetical protein